MIPHFLGVESRTSEAISSLHERLGKNNFSIIRQIPYIKELRAGGETHRSLNYILDLYPKAIFFDEEGMMIDPKSQMDSHLPVFLDFSFVLARLDK